MKLRLQTRILVANLLLPLALAQTTARLSLLTVDGAGAALPNVRLALLAEPVVDDTRKQASLPNLSPLRGSSDAKGLADFGSIATGRYRVCAEAAQHLVLNPCVWGQRVVFLNVSVEAEKTLPARIVLGQGARLRVTIVDAGDTLAQLEGKAVGNYVAVEAWSTGYGYIPVLPLSKQAAKSKVLEAIVPRGIKLSVRATSPGFTLVDAATQRRLDNGDQLIDVDIKQDTKLVEVGITAQGAKAK